MLAAVAAEEGKFAMLDAKTTPAKVTLEIGLDQLIAATRNLPPEARDEIRRALDNGDETAGWLNGQPSSATDPILAALWNNDDDAAYDNL